MNRIPLAIAASVVRGWAVRSRVPMSRPGLLVAALGAGVAGISAIVALSLTAVGAHLPDGPYFGALILLSVYLLAGLVAITTTAAAAQSSSTVAWWRAAPVSDRGLAAGFSAPVWVLILIQALILTPGLAILWADSMDPIATSALSLSSIALGAAHGRGLFALARILLNRASSEWQVHGQPFAFVLWAAHLAGAVAYIRWLPTADSGGTLSWLLFPLGYPALASVLLYPAAISVWALLAAIAVAVAVEVWCLPWSTAARQDSGPVLKLGPAYSGLGPLYVWRLEMTRLVRRRRVQAALLSAVVIQAGLCVLVARLDQDLRNSAVDNALLLTALMVSYAPLLARGNSDRSRPYALWMGLRPDAWAVSVTAAAVSVALGAATPGLGVLAVVIGSVDVFVMGLGLVLFMATVAAAVGFVLQPSDDTGAAETLGAGIVIAVTFGAGKMLAGAGIEELSIAALVLAASSPLVVSIPVVVETARWKNVVGGQGEGPARSGDEVAVAVANALKGT